LGVFPGTNCKQVEHCLSPFGLSWYFIAVRIAALVEAITFPDKAATGIMAIAAPPIFRNCRREGLLSSFITDFLSNTVNE
jgi:hypothetical protein